MGGAAVLGWMWLRPRLHRGGPTLVGGLGLAVAGWCCTRRLVACVRWGAAWGALGGGWGVCDGLCVCIACWPVCWRDGAVVTTRGWCLGDVRGPSCAGVPWCIVVWLLVMTGGLLVL